MEKKIGISAGAIWSYLNKHGSQSLTALAKGAGGDKNMFHWGLGWLAREGKIVIKKIKGKYEISLVE